MMTARGKIQRIAAGEISVIGRNTQGVRIMSLDEDDSLAAIVRVPARGSCGSEERRIVEIQGIAQEIAEGTRTSASLSLSFALRCHVSSCAATGFVKHLVF